MPPATRIVSRWIHYVGTRRFAAAASLLAVVTLLLVATYGRPKHPCEVPRQRRVSKAVVRSLHRTVPTASQRQSPARRSEPDCMNSSRDLLSSNTKVVRL